MKYKYVCVVSLSWVEPLEGLLNKYWTMDLMTYDTECANNTVSYITHD